MLVARSPSKDTPIYFDVTGAPNREQFEAAFPDGKECQGSAPEAVVIVDDVEDSRADYAADEFWGGTGAINANLLTGMATDGFGNQDMLMNIEALRGNVDIESELGESLLKCDPEKQIHRKRITCSLIF